VDHINPVARQGEHAYGNLRVVCMACNSAKGPLTIAEWDDLLELLASWPAPIAANTLARLRAGGRQARLQMRDPSVRPGP
jgi:5-methylcytosine-specific restriction endonuclease McrA